MKTTWEEEEEEEEQQQQQQQLRTTPTPSSPSLPPPLLLRLLAPLLEGWPSFPPSLPPSFLIITLLFTRCIRPSLPVRDWRRWSWLGVGWAMPA